MPIDRIAGRHRQLRAEMVGRASIARRHRLRYWRASPDASPPPEPDQAVSESPRISFSACSAPGVQVAVAVEGVFDLGAEAFGQSFRRGGELRLVPVALGRVAVDRPTSHWTGSLPGASIPVGAGSGPSSGALQQRIALKLVLDKSGQLDASEYCSSLIACKSCGVMARDGPGEQHFGGQSHSLLATANRARADGLSAHFLHTRFAKPRPRKKSPRPTVWASG